MINSLWGNMKEEGVLVDYYTLRMVQNLRMQMMKLSDALISEGQNEKAIAILDKTFEIMPIENNQVAPDDICFYLVGNYYDAGAKEKGDALGKKLALLELEKIDHYQSLNEYFFDKVWTEWGRSLNNLRNVKTSINWRIRPRSYDCFRPNKHFLYEPRSIAKNWI